MVSKEILIQYSDLQEEIKYLRKKIDSLQNEQSEMDGRKKHSIVQASMKDFPYTQHNVHTEGYIGLTKISSNHLQKLEKRYEELLQVTNDVMDFIESINDSRMRMIVTYRFIENYTWEKVADAMGGGNTENGVKSAFHRFIDKI